MTVWNDVKSEENSEVQQCMLLTDWAVNPAPTATLFGAPATVKAVITFAARCGFDPATGRGKASMAHGGALEVVVDGMVVMLYWDAA